MNPADLTRAEPIATVLAEARARDGTECFVGEIECYCKDSDCAIREVTLVLKELHGPTTPARLRCPACRRPLKMHHALTRDEARRAFERAARVSVNVQRYRRQAGEDAAIPLGALLDDALPEVSS